MKTTNTIDELEQKFNELKQLHKYDITPATLTFPTTKTKQDDSLIIVLETLTAPEVNGD